MNDLSNLFTNGIGRALGSPPPRLDRTGVGGFTISTVDSYDMGYETAVLDAQGTYPVERYDTEEEALKGHQKWVKKAEKFKSGTRITELGYGSLVDETKVVLKSAQPPTHSRKEEN